MKDTTPIFILGSGRCGTFQMMKLLETAPDIEAHHEYLFENILKTAVLYRMGVVDKPEVKALLSKTHIPAVYYSKSNFWVDSSNALPWIVNPLYELFPNARFVHLVRDGRKVVSSFYNKFNEVMYDDRNVEIVQDWLINRVNKMEPSPEKKYWRPFPVKGESYSEEFIGYDRFQRLCYYWQDCNLTIKSALEALPVKQTCTFRLEDIISQPEELKRFLSLFGIPYDEKYMMLLKRPVNVHVPKNFELTDVQRRQFQDIAESAMKVFGYDGREEYSVEY